MTDQTSGEERVIRLASIVSIDIVGFSTMSERDQRNAARKVENLRARIERVAVANGGRLFNTAGDGFMLEFASAGQALGATQELLDKRSKGEPPIRVGAHVGDVIVTATDDLLGHGVNVAARLQELAEPRTALVSSEFRSMARNSPQSAFQSKGQKPLENIDQRVQTFEILSKRQKFARSSRRIGSMALAAAVLGVLAYFSPQLYSIGMEYWRNRPQPAAEQSQANTEQAAATPAETPASPTEDSPTRVPGYAFSDCTGCPEMTVLAGGLFVMGSPDNEPGRGRDEGPQREVSVTPFAMGKYEVTFAQWDACLAGGGCNGYSPPDAGWGRGDRPVTGVSSKDAQAYVNWLNAQVGGTSYRLPSEAEWEYAARAGQAAAYAFGARVTQTEATLHARQTTPVGAHAPNAFGIYDMHGNAGELVEDCYAANYDLAPIDGVAVEADECGRRVYRGGSYNDQAPVLRAAARRSTEPTSRTQGIGFRVARSLD
ncbi:MAG: SUMF1/EgtB/PvdO family nonheme iron enzyme [Hyphomonadaceae bacterium]|nr:SUMF1/EgtB/PvdO family nonheme iron enzyme [Hyphomonadaceae bacterium]